MVSGLTESESIFEAFRQWGGNLVFLALDPFLALPMAGLLDSARVLVVTWDAGPAAAQLEAEGVTVLSVGERLGGRRASDRLLECPAVRAEIMRRARLGPVGVLTFKPNHRLEKAIQSFGFDREHVRLLAAPAGLARSFENKLRFPALVADYGVRLPPYEILRPDQGPGFAELSTRLGETLVVQVGAGFSGAGTSLVSSEAEWQACIGRRPERPVKVSRFVSGVAITVNGCVTSSGAVVLGPLMEQLTGLPELTPYPLGSCGNVWGAPGLSLRARNDCESQAEAVGAALSAQGYRGHFGVDLVAGDDAEVGAQVIECNARVTATLPVATALSRVRGEVSLFALHVLTQLGLADSDWFKREPCGPFTQLIVRHGDEKGRRTEGRPWQQLDLATGQRRYGHLTKETLSQPDKALLIWAAGGREVESGAEIGRLLVAGELYGRRDQIFRRLAEARAERLPSLGV